MKFIARISGTKELEAALGQFTKATQRRVLERALKRSAEPIRRAAADNVPIDTGNLRKSIKTVVVRSSAGRAAFADAMRQGATRVEAGRAARAANRAAKGTGPSARARVQATARHAAWVEFGTFKMPGRPYMAPAVALNGPRAQASVRNDLKLEIEATAKRVAKRAARKRKIV